MTPPSLIPFLSSSSDASVGRRSSEVCGIALQEGLGSGSSCTCTCRFLVHLPAFLQVKSSKLSTSGKRSAEVHCMYMYIVHVHVPLCHTCSTSRCVVCVCVCVCACACVCVCRMHLGMVKQQILLQRRSDRGNEYYTCTLYICQSSLFLPLSLSPALPLSLSPALPLSLFLSPSHPLPSPSPSPLIFYRALYISLQSILIWHGRG